MAERALHEMRALIRLMQEEMGMVQEKKKKAQEEEEQRRKQEELHAKQEAQKKEEQLIKEKAQRKGGCLSFDLGFKREVCSYYTNKIIFEFYKNT